MRSVRIALLLLVLTALVAPAFVAAGPYDDDWQGIMAEVIYPWGKRLWEPMERVVPKKAYRIGVSIPSLGSPYFVNQVYGYLTEAQATGVGISILAAKGYEDLQGQVSQIENLINKKVDALAIAPISAEGIAAVVNVAIQKKIPVYFLGEAAHTKNLTGYASENDYDLGFRGMDWLCRNLKGRGKIAILAGPAGNTYTESINKGARAALKNYPDVKLVDEKWGDSEDPAVGQELAENLLNATPDLNGFLVVEAQVHGVANTLKERKLTDKVACVAVYPFQETIPYVQDGSVDYGVTGYSLTNARILVNMIIRNLNGEPEVPRYVWTPGLDMTREGIARFPRYHVWAPEGWQPPSVMVVEPKKK
jgi:ABC-type sugar transport system substrate-binding protein